MNHSTVPRSVFRSSDNPSNKNPRSIYSNFNYTNMTDSNTRSGYAWVMARRGEQLDDEDSLGHDDEMDLQVLPRQNHSQTTINAAVVDHFVDRAGGYGQLVANWTGNQEVTTTGNGTNGTNAVTPNGDSASFSNQLCLSKSSSKRQLDTENADYSADGQTGTDSNGTPEPFPKRSKSSLFATTEPASAAHRVEVNGTDEDVSMAE